MKDLKLIKRSKPKILKRVGKQKQEIMALTTIELETLKANSLSVSNARDIATQIESDHTIGGIFPAGASGDFTNPDEEKFKAKWCGWWPVAKILLTLAKIFTGDNADKAIDAILNLGNSICTPANPN